MRRRSLAAFVQHGDRKHAQQRLVCRGEVQASAGDVHPLARLTDAHIRALFEAGRLEALGEPAAWTDPATGTVHRGTDAWVALFKHKRAQVSAVRGGAEATGLAP